MDEQRRVCHDAKVGAADPIVLIGYHQCKLGQTSCEPLCDILRHTTKTALGCSQESFYQPISLGSVCTCLSRRMHVTWKLGIVIVIVSASQLLRPFLCLSESCGAKLGGRCMMRDRIYALALWQAVHLSPPRPH